MEYIIGQERRRRRPRPRIYRPRTSFLNLTEEECRLKLHLSREVVARVCQLVARDIEGNPPGSCALPVAVKVTTALAFYATCAFQHTLGLVTGIDQATASRALTAVTTSLVRHAGDFISFPRSPDSQRRMKESFYATCGIPGVLGAIDCTHVLLRAPPEDAIVYVNRKGAHSIKVQVVCDAHNAVTHVYANYPGSAHDSFILQNSEIPGLFQQGALDGWLLGDNGYGLKTWLITPYITPTTRRQHVFNQLFSRARCVIERTFGMLKMRFRCLDKSGGVLEYSPQKVGAFVVACCVLHNIAISQGHRIDLDEGVLQDLRDREADLHVVAAALPEAQAAQQVREQLAAELVPQ